MDHSRLGSGESTGTDGSRALKRRGRSATRGAWLPLGLLAATLALAGGCQRKGYKPLPSDTPGTVNGDSAAAQVQAALDRWDSGSGDDAAKLSAGVVLAELRRIPPAGWGDRTRSYLDSLGVGAEVGAAPGALLVNFFSRSDPDRGSWPYLFWGDEKNPRMQAIEGKDLRFSDLATRPGKGGALANVAALFARRGATGGQPISFAWKPDKTGAWSLLQTLGADSLGGAGTGEFTMQDSTMLLTTRTYKAARGFTECATCPHVYSKHEFRWAPGGFVRVSDEQVASPYSTFVRFVQAVQANDRDRANEEVTDGSLWDQARGFEWQQPRGAWRVAPSTDETAHEMTFFRGEHEAYRVSFEGRVGEWRISAIEETSRNVE